MAEPLMNAEEQNAPVRYIAVDTTEFFDCPFLDSPRWSQLMAYLRRTTSKLIVPKVVVGEAKRHFRNALANASQKVASATAELRRLLRTEVVRVPEIDIDEACSNYETELARLLRSCGTITPQYSTVDIASIMERCLEGRRPFDSSGKKGFRDAVIWESILNAAQAPSETIFVTRNTRDFGAHGGLAETLLEESNGSGRSIRICDGLDKFADEYVKPALEVLDDVKPKIEDEDFLFDLIHQVIHGLDITDKVRRSLGGDIYSASIGSIPSLESEGGDVFDLGTGLLSCSVAYSGHADVSIVEVEYEGLVEPVSLHGGELPAHVDLSIEITFRLADDDEIVLDSFESEDVQVQFDL